MASTILKRLFIGWALIIGMIVYSALLGARQAMTKAEAVARDFTKEWLGAGLQFGTGPIISAFRRNR